MTDKDEKRLTTLLDEVYGILTGGHQTWGKIVVDRGRNGETKIQPPEVYLPLDIPSTQAKLKKD